MGISPAKSTKYGTVPPVYVPEVANKTPGVD
jgi:hypothetical protein